MSEERTAAIHIIGIGSSSDCDTLGWLVAERLANSDWGRRYPEQVIEITACATPAQLPAMLGVSGLLILVDALLDSGTAGDVVALDGADLARHATTSSHGIGVAEALALIQVLSGDAVVPVVLGISTGRTGQSAEELLAQAWPALGTALDRVIGNYLGNL